MTLVFWLLFVPLMVSLFAYLGAAIFVSLRNSRLDSYVDNDVESTEAIGDQWKSPAPEVEVAPHNYPVVNIHAAERKFDEFYNEEKANMEPDPDADPDDVYFRDTPETVKAYNRARLRMMEWLVNKQVRSSSGQACDFLAMNPERVVSQPFVNDRKRLENLMKDVRLNWNDVYRIVWRDIEKKTPGEHEDLVKTTLAQQIRDNERKRVTQEILAQVKEIQKKFEDEQFTLEMEKKNLTARVEALVAEVKKKNEELAALAMPYPVDYTEELPPLEVAVSPRKRKPAKKSKKTKRKN